MLEFLNFIYFLYFKFKEFPKSLEISPSAIPRNRHVQWIRKQVDQSGCCHCSLLHFTSLHFQLPLRPPAAWLMSVSSAPVASDSGEISDSIGDICLWALARVRVSLLGRRRSTRARALSGANLSISEQLPHSPTFRGGICWPGQRWCGATACAKFGIRWNVVFWRITDKWRLLHSPRGDIRRQRPCSS